MCIVLSVANSVFELTEFASDRIGWLNRRVDQDTFTQCKVRMIVILSMSLAYLFAHIVMCLLRRRKVVARIVSSLCFAALFGAVTLWALFHPSQFPHLWQWSFQSNGIYAVDITILLLSVHILFAATSAYNISGFKNTRCVTQEQAELVETAIFGTIPLFLIIATSTMCREELIVILTVSFGQVTVLLAPIFTEYV